ncbi:MAG: tRNA (adenosine(37)-N6)-threonylcarbamoyltransferase complex transferase subunit TsaD, partial [Patescibacteria group bacterium]
EMAARKQLECIVPALQEGLECAKIAPTDLDAIAVTKGPGLLPSLLVGVAAARIFVSRFSLPLMGVHHTLGHLDSPWLESEEEIPFPLLTLSVSGGHTELWLRTSHTKGTLLGRTLDDAAGEAFDKGAVLLGLPYPGGPALSRLAESGDPHAFSFPKLLPGKKRLDMSFSGLKTSLKYLLRDKGSLEALSDEEKKDLAASYQEAICSHLVSRVLTALELHPEAHEVHLVGGVSANVRLRSFLRQSLHSRIPIRTPTRFEYCTDNAAMIASAAFFMREELGEKAQDSFEVDASQKPVAF